MNAIANLPSWLVAPTFPVENWFADLQQAAWLAFAATGLPTFRHEGWKYADLGFLQGKEYVAVKENRMPVFAGMTGEITSALQVVIEQHRLPAQEAILLVCVNGRFIPELSELARLPVGITVCHLQTAVAQHAALLQPLLKEEWNTAKYPLAALNLAMSMDGIFFHQPQQVQLDLPIQVLSIADGEAQFVAHPLHCFITGQALNLIETYHAMDAQDYFLNSVMHIGLTAGAKVHHCKIQQEAQAATHIAHTFVHQANDSHYDLTNIASGAKFARDEIIVNLSGVGAQCGTSGFYYLQQANQYIDHHIDIAHSAPHTQSEMLYKGIVANKARAVFNGRLHVKPGSQKVLAYQANHNLLLAKFAEAYSKPELEIYADDVKCKHGATTGQIDSEALFYLRARGIDHQTAMAMLLTGFVEDIIKRIHQPSLRAKVRNIL